MAGWLAPWPGGGTVVHRSMALARPQRGSGEGARSLRGSLEPTYSKGERHGGQWGRKGDGVPREMETALRAD